MLAVGFLVHAEFKKKDQAYAHSEARAMRMAKEISDLKIELYQCKNNK